LPTSSQDERYPPLEPFDHVDPGSRALTHEDPNAFLANAIVSDLTPRYGSEIRGVNLARLNAEGRDQLALYAARRGVVAFRGQDDFINAPPEEYLEWGRHFGRLHIHPTTGHPKGYPELHLVYRDGSSTFNQEQDENLTPTVLHSDVSYEAQPPVLTTFFLVDQPPTGGDTAFSSQVITLKRFSPPFVAFLRTLKAVHSGVEQAIHFRSGKCGGFVRREPVENVHPIVRKHPVTGEEALYVNRLFTIRIVGLKKEESDAILNLLYDHIEKSVDSQLRLRWEPGTVVIWDNRVSTHTPILDFDFPEAKEWVRHGVRITPQAERPIPALDE